MNIDVVERLLKEWISTLDDEIWQDVIDTNKGLVTDLVLYPDSDWGNNHKSFIDWLKDYEA